MNKYTIIVTLRELEESAEEMVTNTYICEPGQELVHLMPGKLKEFSFTVEEVRVLDKSKENV